MTAKLRMLLYSDGSDIGTRALRLSARIARAMAEAVDILVIARSPEREEASSQEAQRTVQELRASGIPVTIYHRPGSTSQKVIQQADAVDYDLIVIGSRGRRGMRRLLAGSKACTVLGGAATSVLVVKGPERDEIEQILTCSAAGPASEDTVRFAARLAHALEASVTLLHVMSQVALEETAKGADLEAGAEELMEQEAREGAHLHAMLQILRNEKVEAHAVVRHGLVVEEITKEAEEGHFDMLIVGAHVTPDIDSLLSSDLSEQIMLAANRPVLIVHQD
ncbi:MAG: universal stress protein [Chloroflexota bacterium]